MKTSFLSALVLASSTGVAVMATGATTTCDLTTIKASLAANTNVKKEFTTNEPVCKSDSKFDIFDITKFPPNSTQADAAQKSSACSSLVNLVNGYANAASQCTVTVNNVTVIYGHVISNFVDGRVYNESASDSGSVGDSESESGSESASSSNSTDVASSGVSVTVLSLVAYSTIAAIAAILC
ncbi:hypothetical protein PRIC1_006573 [Phytophthora ramorum]